MKAAVLYGKENIKVEDIKSPQISERGIIIKIDYASICNTTDNKIYRAKDPSKVWPFQKIPFILGHECSGEIVEIGSLWKDKFKIGERVIFWCMGYGAFAEYAQIFPEYLAITKIKNELMPQTAPLMEMVTGTLRLLILNDDFIIKKRDNVVIFGLGPSGLLYLQEAKIIGANKVICFDHSDFKIKKAKELKADLCLNTEKEDSEKILKDIKDSIDVVIDACGGDIIEEANKILKHGGFYISFGVPKDEGIIKKREILKSKNIQIIDTVKLINAQKAIEIGKKWVENGELNLSSIITHRIPIEKIKEGLDLCYFDRKNTLKVIVEI